LDAVSREYQLHPAPASQPLRIDYAGELNGQQYEAVTAPPGPSLVLAGAGAGKTRTLTYRVAWLIEHDVPADRILLLTFTNKSAREMMQRVAELLGGDVSTLWGGTFHSVGVRILRRHADRLGYRRDFTIADREDVKDLLSACIADSGIDVKAVRFPKPEALADLYSMMSNTGKSLEEASGGEKGPMAPVLDGVRAVRTRFIQRKKSAGLMDFDDLLTLWVRLLRDFPDIAELYQRRFQHVLVDEYQDTNRLQGELLDLLTARHRNLMAVGDDAQSIYSWRGADFTNILNFPERHAGARVYKIETNYRSTPEILALANAAIAANTRQFPKALQAARGSGMKPALIVTTDAREQASFVAQRALELRDEGVPLDQQCVLYRSHFHAMELQMELTRRNIPYAITSGIRFFEQAHIKDVAAYLKLITNPSDELALKRLARMLPGVGNKAADKIWAAFHAQLAAVVGLPIPPEDSGDDETPISEPTPPPADNELSDNDGVIPDAPPPIPVAPLLAAVSKAVPKKSAAAWAQFTATIAQSEGAHFRNAPGRMIRLIVEADYEDYLVTAYENSRNRLEDLVQLAAYADQFTDTATFLAQLALQTNLEAEQAQPRDDDSDRLRLSTVHQAKGLEFQAVFAIMLCDGLFPSGRSSETSDGEEEERRLFYVAVTRAKDELYLCRPLLRFMAGGGDALQLPSRFLGELTPDLYEEWNVRPNPSPAYNPVRRQPEDRFPRGEALRQKAPEPDVHPGFEPDPDPSDDSDPF
jgi:DNA helicase-2/ATP-dependent DNA helicase PcrA